MHCEGFCAILTTGTRPFAALSVFQYTGIAVSKQTETGKPHLTFFSVSNYVLYSFLIKLYNKSGTPPSQARAPPRRRADGVS